MFFRSIQKIKRQDNIKAINKITKSVEYCMMNCVEKA